MNDSTNLTAGLAAARSTISEMSDECVLQLMRSFMARFVELDRSDCAQQQVRHKVLIANEMPTNLTICLKMEQSEADSEKKAKPPKEVTETVVVDREVITKITATLDKHTEALNDIRGAIKHGQAKG